MRSRALDQTGSSAKNDAAILAAGLQSELDKFSLVPLVLAEDPEVQSLLAGNATGAATINNLNRRLEGLAKQTDAAAIYLMDRNGLSLAASNWRLPESFVGSIYDFRPYFKLAMVNGSSTQFALGTVSRKPGLYIAQRVGPPDKPTGIVAVKVEFDTLEANWRASTEGVFVTDRDGVVLIASNDDWRFKLSPGRNPSDRTAETNRQQFGIEKLEPLGLSGLPDKQDLVAAPLLDTEQPITLDGWILHLLVDPSPSVSASVANGRLSLLGGALLAGSILAGLLFFRRKREIEAEANVAARTRALREQLSQANRLATLGQVSAGVAHEINQPLAAARIFAENGVRLLNSGNDQAASENFSQIVSLTERIGIITDELRRFSRKQVSEPRAMSIGEALNGALLLLHDRIHTLATKLDLPASDDLAIQVRAEHVRLEQVLVNLLQNALDATGIGGEVKLSIT
ncbi:MAG: cache domain-containing protein, partial [Pontixanthobacter sp.]